MAPNDTSNSDKSKKMRNENASGKKKKVFISNESEQIVFDNNKAPDEISENKNERTQNIKTNFERKKRPKRLKSVTSKNKATLRKLKEKQNRRLTNNEDESLKKSKKTYRNNYRKEILKPRIRSESYIKSRSSRFKNLQKDYGSNYREKPLNDSLPKSNAKNNANIIDRNIIRGADEKLKKLNSEEKTNEHTEKIQLKTDLITKNKPIQANDTALQNKPQELAPEKPQATSRNIVGGMRDTLTRVSKKITSTGSKISNKLETLGFKTERKEYIPLNNEPPIKKDANINNNGSHKPEEKESVRNNADIIDRNKIKQIAEQLKSSGLKRQTPTRKASISKNKTDKPERAR